MKRYHIGYRFTSSNLMMPREVYHYTFDADDLEHAIEQFRSAEPDMVGIRIVYVAVLD